MSTLALPPLPDTAEPPPAESAGVVINDGFFPDVDLDDLRASARITGSVPNIRLRDAVVAAIISVEQDLAGWAAAQRAAGSQTLADVPGPSIDGRPRHVHLYHRAVRMYAKAELIERLPDFDTTGAGSKDFDQQGESVADLRRDAIHAVRDILGRGRTAVELI